MKLRKNLLDFMEKKNLKAADLARKSGVPKQRISDWLAGASVRNIGQLKEVASRHVSPLKIMTTNEVTKMCFALLWRSNSRSQICVGPVPQTHQPYLVAFENEKVAKEFCARLSFGQVQSPLTAPNNYQKIGLHPDGKTIIYRQHP